MCRQLKTSAAGAAAASGSASSRSTPQNAAAALLAIGTVGGAAALCLVPSDKPQRQAQHEHVQGQRVMAAEPTEPDLWDKYAAAEEGWAELRCCVEGHRSPYPAALLPPP